MSRIVYYAAISLDGFIASSDGGVDWLAPFDAKELGYDVFFARVKGVVIGRATYEQALIFAPWAYKGRKALVVASRPVADLPEGAEAVTLEALPAALRALRARITGDIWVVGGGKTARACMRAGLLDELELYIVPRLLGAGVPLFEPAEAPAVLRLVETRAFPNGVVMMRHAVER